jgi:lipid-A-disaccharide synthase
VDRPVRIAMVAGEASGDQLGAHLIRAIRRHLPGARFVGIGGPRMEAEGFEAWVPSEKLAVRGLFEVLRHLLPIARIRRQLKRRLLADPPDAFVGIDAPDFNLGLERRLKARGIPTIHYVGPSVWAWRRGRLRAIARAVSHMLVLFPFEPQHYREHGIPVTYVGHPLADGFPLEPDRPGTRERLGLAEDGLVFAVLPGSRQSEIEYMAEPFIGAVRLLHERFPAALFLVPLASRETRLLFESALYRLGAQDLPVKLLFGHAHDALAAADGVLVASGTATLEAALMKRPMVIAYRLSPWTYRIARRTVRLPFVGLPNILAGRFVVPEFIQDEATPENLAQALGNLVSDRVTCARLSRLFADLHRLLRQDTAEQAAAAILPLLGDRTCLLPSGQAA